MLGTSDTRESLQQSALDVLIRAGVVVILAVSCYAVFRPFLDLMLWSMILAVILYPLERKLRGRLGSKDGLISTLIVLLAIAILLVPVFLLAASMAASMQESLLLIRSGNVHVPPPADSVAGWPLIGKSVHGLWLQASTDLTALTQQYAPQIKAFSMTLLGKLAGFGLGLLLFIVALIIAGIFMAYGEGGTRSAVQIASRFVGPTRGPQIAALCTSTIRAVAIGVVGIAFIQMMLIGIGFVLIGVPGAGLLALAVLLFGIAQAPAALITIPVIIYVLATRDLSAWNIALAIYLFVAGLADNVLKPLLLGRGVAVPMPVVLIGALGGMVTKGVLGLFLGPVLLAVGYVLFWQWVRQQPEPVVEKAKTVGKAKKA